MTTARAKIERIYRESVMAVDPRESVRASIAVDPSNGQLTIDRDTVAIGNAGVYLIAIGKAAQAMTEGALEALGDLVRAGIVVAKQARKFGHPAIVTLEGSHPVPGENSLEAGQRVIDFARNVPEDALVLCLISGGGSSLVEALRPGIALEDLQDVTRRLLRGGASINTLNAVRSRLSRIKGGGLLGELAHARVINLIISDVLGDDLDAIASGPTVQPTSSAPAEQVLKRYGVDIDLPAPSRRDPGLPLQTRIVANLDTALDAAVVSAQRLGLNPVVLTNRLEGEASVAGRIVASMLLMQARPFAAFASGTCLIAGGETTVTVRGNGAGGRNTEAALAAALCLLGSKGLTLGFLATDGDDGMTNAAGAIVDGATIPESGIEEARDALAENDSYGYLSRTGATWSPGATGTNVNDLVIGIVE